jgi:ring-1,2-phenylacetyl-CoA epoxidase subunit PaaE
MNTLQFSVTRILREGDGAATIFLKKTDGLPLSYQAGQFLTFIFKVHNKELRRSYSFSSTPFIDPEISITVKRIPNGEISRYLFGYLRTGDMLTALPPAGMFTIHTGPGLQRQFFLIAAGSGIIPVFSLLKKIIWDEPGSQVILIDQNQNEDQIIFKKQLTILAREFPSQFRWINLLSKPGQASIGPERLTNQRLEQIVLDFLSGSPSFYLCGPSAFMRMAEFTLRLMGFADNQIKKEHFTVDYIPPAPLISNPKPRQLKIHYQQKTFITETVYPQTILQTALNNNIQIPYSCRGGRCSTCVAKCVHGIVKMSINEVLTEKDLADGLVLTCVGYAQSDVEIRI